MEGRQASIAPLPARWLVASPVPQYGDDMRKPKPLYAQINAAFVRAGYREIPSLYTFVIARLIRTERARARQVVRRVKNSHQPSIQSVDEAIVFTQACDDILRGLK